MDSCTFNQYEGVILVRAIKAIYAQALGHSVTWSLGHSVTQSLGHSVIHYSSIFNVATNGLTRDRTYRSASQTTRVKMTPNQTDAIAKY